MLASPLREWFKRHPKVSARALSLATAEFDGTMVDPSQLSRYRNADKSVEAWRRQETPQLQKGILPGPMVMARLSFGTGKLTRGLDVLRAEAWMPLRQALSAIRHEVAEAEAPASGEEG